MLVVMHQNQRRLFCLLILLNFIDLSQSIDESQFFAYQDGNLLPREDDSHSEQIILSPEIPFIATKYESVYVSDRLSFFFAIQFFSTSFVQINTNGFLSFLLPIAYFFPQITLTSYSGYAIVAPFWADFDSSIKNGSISYK